MQARDAPNLGYDASGAPYYDDIDGDGVHDIRRAIGRDRRRASGGCGSVS